MKTQLLKSLIAFLIFNSAFLISANAQIVYTDINPDVTRTCSSSPCSQTYNLDLNNDGTTDFIIGSYHIGKANPWGPSNINSSVKITPQGNNLFASTTFNSVKRFSQFDSIGTTQLWHAASSQYFKLVSSNIGGGEWNNEANKYVGLKLVVGGQNYYGWARLNVNVILVSSTFTIKDFAYNNIPNQPILAGETTCTAPTVTLSASGPLSFCAGDSVTLTANGTGYQYQWKRNGVNILGANAKMYVAKTAGKYKCRVTNSCGSKTSKADTVKVPCRITNENNVETLERLSVYPNPASNSVTIKIPSDEAGEIQIINLFGRVLETHNYASLRDASLQIDVARFPTGMYIVRWNSGDNYQTEKFSVIK